MDILSKLAITLLFVSACCNANPPCKDNYPYCKKISLLRVDICTATNSRPWAMGQCRKFCNFCSNNQGTSTSPPTTAAITSTRGTSTSQSPSSTPTPTNTLAVTQTTGQPITIGGTCTDKVGSVCIAFPAICTHPAQRAYARVNCAKTCGFCGKSTTVTTTPSTTTSSSTTLIPTNAPTTTPSTPCQDVVPTACIQYKSILCTTPSQRQWAMTHCAKTCAFCSTSSTTRSVSTAGTTNTGQWGAWQPWATCSTSCNLGSKLRYRLCNTPPCTGSYTEVIACNLGMCPSTTATTVAQWGQWAPWSKCSVTCGTGQKVRVRPCPSQNCQGHMNEIQQCRETTCQATTTPSNTAGSASWGAWGAWSACTVTCDVGERVRHRQCTKTGNTSKCPGQDIERELCSVWTCPGTYSLRVTVRWSQWSDCSVTCGDGLKTRVQRCLTGFCANQIIDTRQHPCNMGRCP